MFFKITWKLHVACNVLAILMIIPLLGFINGVNDLFFSSQFISTPTKSIIINYYLLLFFILAVITFIHEWIHGLTYKFLGGKVKYGYRIIYAYTQEISELPIRRNGFIAVLLMPLFVITLICLVFNNFFTGMALIINLTGASGDIIMAFTLLQYSKDARIIDRRYGYEVVEGVK